MPTVETETQKAAEPKPAEESAARTRLNSETSHSKTVEALQQRFGGVQHDRTIIFMDTDWLTMNYASRGSGSSLDEDQMAQLIADYAREKAGIEMNVEDLKKHIAEAEGIDNSDMIRGSGYVAALVAKNFVPSSSSTYCFVFPESPDINSQHFLNDDAGIGHVLSDSFADDKFKTKHPEWIRDYFNYHETGHALDPTVLENVAHGYERRKGYEALLKKDGIKESAIDDKGNERYAALDKKLDRMEALERNATESFGDIHAALHVARDKLTAGHSRADIKDFMVYMRDMRMIMLSQIGLEVLEADDDRFQEKDIYGYGLDAAHKSVSFKLNTMTEDQIRALTDEDILNITSEIRAEAIKRTPFVIDACELIRKGRLDDLTPQEKAKIHPEVLDTAYEIRGQTYGALSRHKVIDASVTTGDNLLVMGDIREWSEMKVDKAVVKARVQEMVTQMTEAVVGKALERNLIPNIYVGIAVEDPKWFAENYLDKIEASEEFVVEIWLEHKEKLRADLAKPGLSAEQREVLEETLEAADLLITDTKAFTKRFAPEEPKPADVKPDAAKPAEDTAPAKKIGFTPCCPS